MQPVLVDGDVAIYHVQDRNAVDVDALVYFAASVFWRAAARPWLLSGEWRQPASLGPYFDSTRRYLLGEASLPREWRLFVHVWSEEGIDFTSTIPYSERIHGTHRHKFCIPGITFIGFVGNRAPAQFDSGAANSTDGTFIWVCPWQEDDLYEGLGKMMLNAIKKRRRPA